ncbi:MAG: type II secretion system major pseudopilin GspG [Bdellovibrionota bacterium]|nr:type II secretion system major pseudopilin GspG [Bdellovibrionota bacterium]
MRKNLHTINNQSGMSLIEIMIVLALIVTIMTTVGQSVMDQFRGSQVRNAKIQMGEITKALDRYNLDCNVYPSTEQGLSALMTAPSSCSNWGPTPYIKKKLTIDPWGGEFQYELISSSEFELISLGADKAEGGEGLDADISNLDGDEEEE